MGEYVRHTEAACELHTPLHAMLLGQRSKASVDEKSIYAFKKFYIQHACRVDAGIMRQLNLNYYSLV